MAPERLQSRTFEEVAALYDRARPGYPDSLIETVLAAATLGPEGRILEVGCGTGKATRPFARRGHAMLCIEPGESMADVARASCADHPAVRFFHGSFEDWPLEEGAFDLAISAQAFHWVDPAVGYSKLAACLRDGGVAALFWNRPLTDGSALRADIERAYERHAPHMVKRSAPGAGAGEIPAKSRLDGSGAFEPVERSVHPWSTSYGPDEYRALMNTQSDHRLLEPALREALLDDLCEAIVRHGGELAVDYEAWLFLARRRAR